jgi:hypothetical protein
MIVYGIGAAQVADKVGETIDIKGLDVSDLRYLNDEHGDKMSDMLGSIRKYKKIFNEKDADSDWQKRCWREVKAPFLYFEGEIIDDMEHEDAKAAKALMRYVTAHPELPLRVGGSVEGGIVERTGPDNKFLTRTVGKGISLTVKPCNSACKVFMAQDLQKSEPPSCMPEKYQQRLLETWYTPQIREPAFVSLQDQLEILHKSVVSLFGQFTDVSCKKCGHSDRFFKSSNSWPNACVSCGDRFTMKQLFNALSKN